MALAGASSAMAQSRVLQRGAPSSAKVNFQGTLGASAVASWAKEGDIFEGECLGRFDGNVGVTLRFSGFADPQGLGASSHFSMAIRLEVLGVGVVYDGPADGLNAQVVQLEAASLKSGVSIKLSRKVVAIKTVPAGNYVNRGSVIVSLM